MAIMAPARAGYRVENGHAAFVLGIVEQGPGPLQGRRAEIIRVARHRIAGGIADRAVDTFNASIRLNPRGTFRVDRCNRIVPRERAVMHALCGNPFVEKRVHIDRKILDNRQVAQRPDSDRIAVQHLRDMGAAGPARHAIDHHRAASAHAHAAGKPIAQRRIRVLLHPGDNIENGLIVIGRHLEPVLPVRATLDRHRKEIGGHGPSGLPKAAHVMQQYN